VTCTACYGKGLFCGIASQSDALAADIVARPADMPIIPATAQGSDRIFLESHPEWIERFNHLRRCDVITCNTIMTADGCRKCPCTPPYCEK